MNRAIEDIEIRLSFSTNSYFTFCERLFELERLRNPMLNSGRTDTVDTMVGNAVHPAIQDLIRYQDKQRAWIKLLLHWNFGLWDIKEKKTWFKTALAIELILDKWDYNRYEVFDVRGKKPDELSFCIYLGGRKHKYLGRMDLVLWDKIDKVFCVLEIKTTGWAYEDVNPLYQNSEQGIGNSVVLNQIDPKHKSFKVIYLVLQYLGKTQVPRIHILTYMKDLKQRLEFLQTLAMRYKDILDRLGKYELFPKRGDGNCIHFGRPCNYFGRCDNVVPTIWSPDRPDEEWDFEFDIDQLVDLQLEGIE